MMRTTALIICVLVIPVQTAVLEQETVIEYLLRKVAELESSQQECSRYQSKMILELNYVKDKLEKSERRISDLEAIVYDMRSAEYTENLSVTLEKDPVYKSTNETDSKFNTEERNITNKPDMKVMTSHKPGILRRDVRGLAMKQIAFCATIASGNGLGPIHEREIVIFDTVLLNEGNGFNKQTGIFTCPLSGIYFFTGSIMAKHGYSSGVHLLVNGETKGNTYADGANSWDQGSISSIVRCEAGQNVWISVYLGSFIHGDYYTSFSGFLLWGDGSILRRDVRGLAMKQIAFCATIASGNGLGPVNAREIVLFDTVLHNEGNGFNKQTGIFTCPLSGIYFFTGSIMAKHGYSSGLHLIVNGETKGITYADGANSWDQGSISSIVRCEAGQNVWISVYTGSFIEWDYYTSFSGFLLWGDGSS